VNLPEFAGILPDSGRLSQCDIGQSLARPMQYTIFQMILQPKNADAGKP